MNEFSSSMASLTEDMASTSSQSNQSSFALFLANYKIHHIIFKSNAYSAVVNGNVTEELKKDYKHCGFGSWYYGAGTKLFASNSIFKKMEDHHKKFHDFINDNIECALTGGCITDVSQKERILNRFKDAEECSNALFILMDELATDVGSNINMQEVLA
ncbi:CZB domain-containing protein [Sulfurimonas sp.]